MSTITATLLTLAGLALLLRDSRVDRGGEVSAILSVAQFTLALLALFGVGYDAERLQLATGASGLAVLAMLMLALGIFLSRPYSRAAMIFSAAGDGALIARRLIPVVLLLPTILAWLLLQGVERHWYGQEGFAALMATVMDYAAHAQCSEIQWQTPDWNQRAIAFYKRAGASAKSKIRFALPIRPIGTNRHDLALN